MRLTIMIATVVFSGTASAKYYVPMYKEVDSVCIYTLNDKNGDQIVRADLKNFRLFTRDKDLTVLVSNDGHRTLAISAKDTDEVLNGTKLYLQFMECKKESK